MHKALEDIKTIADEMNHQECRALTRILAHVLEGKKRGDIGERLDMIVQQIQVRLQEEVLYISLKFQAGKSTA